MLPNKVQEPRVKNSENLLPMVPCSERFSENAHAWHKPIKNQLGDTQVLLCPECKQNFVRFSEAKIIPGKEHYEAWEGKGDLLVIDWVCEFGHSWQTQFGFHKGNTFVRNLNISD